MNASKKYLLLVIFFLIAMFILFLFLFLKKEAPGNNPHPNNTSPSSAPPQTFSLINTTPQNGAVNVFPGEISITFTTNAMFRSENDFMLTITPPLDYPPKLSSKFPAQVVSYQILGGLKKNTAYTISVKEKNSNTVVSWSFTTSNATQQSSSGLVKKEQEDLNNQYYPLFNSVPYSNSDFSIDYTKRLTLLVKIKNNNVDAIKKEVVEWISQKGVDPTTHTINYVNAF